MYAQHFSFSDLPFSIAPNPRFVYLSPQYREALAHLLYGIGMGGGFVALTGEVGTGKTTLCRCLLESLPEDVEIAVIFNPRLNPKELLAAICDELRIVYPPRASLKQLIDVLNQHLLEVHARGKRTVVLIDEAQNLSFDVLEQIRLLTNLETNDTKLLQIILVGQPELNDVLKRRNLRQLAQRITARYHLRPLSRPETRAYILHRLAVSGGKADIFSAPAIAKIYRLSGGIPRVINLLCDRALLGAYSLGKPGVGRTVVRKAAQEVLPATETKRSFAAMAGLLAALSLGLALVALVYFKAVPNFAADVTSNKLSAAVPKPEQPHIAPQQPALKAATAEPAVKSAVPPAPQPAHAPSPPVAQPSFVQLAANPDATQKSAFTQLFKLWGLELPADSADECRLAESKGLRCLFQAGSWMQVRSLGLPALLAFELNGGGKRYAVLSGIQSGKARLVLGESNYAFDPAEFLPFWQGDAVLLWKPPIKKIKFKPGYNGKSVKWLRQQFGIIAKTNWDMYYDKQLQMQVMTFQKNHGLNPDGVVDALTLIHLNRNDNDPSLFEAGPKPLPAAK